MNAAYITEFRRGDQLLKMIPELSGAGFAANNFKMAPREAVATAKAVITSRAGTDSMAHANWVKDLAQVLKRRRTEFVHYKRARTSLVDMGRPTLRGFIEFSRKLPLLQRAAIS